MKNQAYRMTMLFDFYGELLTDRQKEFFDLYYNEDLSLAEIAENYGISRQGVRDAIVRAEGIMSEMEEKTGIIKRFFQAQDQLSSVAADLDAILARNGAKHEDPVLEEHARKARAAIEQLMQE